MLRIIGAWLCMRYANITAYLLTHQQQYELAEYAESREHYWEGELSRLIINRDKGGLFNTGELK